MKTSEILQMVLDVGKYLESNPPKPMTNADRIRAMTDEELAELLRDYQCNTCDWQGDCDESDGCENSILEWLKQEAIE